MSTTTQRRSDDTSIEKFLLSKVNYYSDCFTKLDINGNSLSLINWAAMFGGSFWAGARGIWSLFWITLLGHTIAITTIAHAIWIKTSSTTPSGYSTQLIALGLLLFFFVSISQGLTANWVLWKRFQRWKNSVGVNNAFQINRLIAATTLQISFLVVALSRYGTATTPDYLKIFP